MGFRRLFIMRKDLGMSPGKLAAQVGHCAEAYWMEKFRRTAKFVGNGSYSAQLVLGEDEYERYVNGSFVKTICEARSKDHLLKARDKALELGLFEGQDFGLIFDNCRTELSPEEADGTTLTGIWFKPLDDAVAHEISKKYHLYV